MASNDAKAKVKVINEKEKIPIDGELKDNTLIDSGSNENEGKRRKHSRRSSTMTATPLCTRTITPPPPRKRWLNKITLKHLFNYSRIPYNSNAHLLYIPLGKPPHFDVEGYLGEAIKCVVIFFLSTLAFGML
jgi:hypothetical protein